MTQTVTTKIPTNTETPAAAAASGFARRGLQLVAVAAWAAAIYGSLNLHRNEWLGEWFGHGICGPWGCAARPEALVGYQLFVLTLLAPLGGCLGLWLGGGRGMLTGKALGTIGLALAAAVAGWAGIEMGLLGPEHLRQYAPQKAAFALATETNLPSLQIAAAGLACWLAAWLTRHANPTTTQSAS